MNRNIGLQSAFLHFSTCSSSSSRPNISELLSSPKYKTLFHDICKEPETVTISDSIVEELRSWGRMDFADAKKRKILDEDVHHDLAVKNANLITESEKALMEQIETGHRHLDLFDTLCALCDNGGELLCCEGGCLRAFHATVDTDFGCKSLRLSKDQLHAPRFLCENCQYKKHQCFACGRLGSSDRANNAVVFQCSSETCGHFYHPRCVAKLLHPINESAAEQIQKKIFAGESFTCPVHKCFSCKEIENDEVDELQFAVCRRCPKVYHKGCLPGDISSESSVDKGILQRAWKGLLRKNRILIYCTKHKIDECTLAPVGDYIVFTDVQEKKKASSTDPRSSQGNIVPKKIGFASRRKPEKNPVNKLEVVKKPSAKTNAKQDSPIAETNINLKKESLNGGPDKGLQFGKSKQQGSSRNKCKRSMTHIPATKNSSSSTAIVEDEMEMRRVDITKETSSVKTVEAVERSLKGALMQACYSDGIVDKLNPPTQVEGSDKAIENIIRNVEDHSSSNPKADYECETFDDVTNSKAIENTIRNVVDHSVSDPKADYESEFFDDITKSKVIENTIRNAENHSGSDPKVDYVSGTFDDVTNSKAIENTIRNVEDHSVSDTKADYESKIFDDITKSKIVDKLGCYVLDGDMVVNFCCHAFDFSCMMRQKLAITGKNCSFKHYDVFQSKGDFDLKEEDWKSVVEELLTGIRLIVVVKCPSVVEGVAVNKFIDEILNFKPKLLLLICTRETEKLIRKVSAYDLIWKDTEIISCKSASSVPGSMLHRTYEPALLYLWSRCDWTKCHNLTALGHRHIANEQKDTNMEVETKEVEDLKEVTHEEPANSSVPVQNLQVSRDLQCESRMADALKLRTAFFQDPSHFALDHQSSFLNKSGGWLED